MGGVAREIMGVGAKRKFIPGVGIQVTNFTARSGWSSHSILFAYQRAVSGGRRREAAGLTSCDLTLCNVQRVFGFRGLGLLQISVFNVQNERYDPNFKIFNHGRWFPNA
jgi:hypothetical protein